MSATRLFVSQSSSSLSLATHRRLRPSFLDQNRIGLSSSASSNFKQLLTCDYTSLSQGINSIPQRKFLKNFVVYNSIQPGIPIPSGNPSSSWKGWIIGMVLSIILPFYKHKLNPFLILKREVDTIVDTAELVLDVVEKVAEEVVEIADDLGDKLPEGGKLKCAVDMVENVAREIVKDANLAEELLHKVEKVEKEVESLIEPVIGQLNEVTQEAGDGSLPVDKMGEAPN